MKFHYTFISIALLLFSLNSLFCTANDEELFAASDSSLNQSVSCGISRVVPSLLIVGGQEAKPNSWPWSVAVYQSQTSLFGTSSTRYICGATLINERYVLTAAHCVVRSSGTLPARDFKLVFGAHNLQNSGAQASVSQIKVHPRYSPSRNHYDIALFKLAEPINYNRFTNVLPICLPTPDLANVPVGTLATLVGWGTTSEGGRPSPTLRQVLVPVIDNNECARNYASLLGAGNQIDNTQICAAFPTGGKDTCQGDSGGSMAIQAGPRNAYTQVGIVSFGKGCAQRGYPGVYTRVTSFLDWINENTRN